MITGLVRPLAQNSEQKHGFLQFSKKLDYGLFLLIELARMQQWSLPQQGAEGALSAGQATVSLRNFATANNMSFLFMQKVAFELRKAGIIAAVRGKNGGYRLEKAADLVSLKEVIEVLEGPLSVMHCLIAEGNSNCSRQPTCKMRHGLGIVNQAIVSIFSQTTLIHLLNPTWKPNV